jgi:hypothetical protein
VTEQHSTDGAFEARMQNVAFAHAYDVWLLVLTQRAAEIDLARDGMPPHRPRRSGVRLKRTTKRTIPRTA